MVRQCWQVPFEVCTLCVWIAKELYHHIIVIVTRSFLLGCMVLWLKLLSSRLTTVHFFSYSFYLGHIPDILRACTNSGNDELPLSDIIHWWWVCILYHFYWHTPSWARVKCYEETNILEMIHASISSFMEIRSCFNQHALLTFLFLLHSYEIWP